IPTFRRIHLDGAPPHLVRERERGARLPNAGIALENDRAFVRPTLVPGRSPLSEFCHGGGIPGDLVEGLGSILLRPTRHCLRGKRVGAVITVSARETKTDGIVASYVLFSCYMTILENIRGTLIQLSSPFPSDRTSRIARRGTLLTSS